MSLPAGVDPRIARATQSCRPLDPVAVTWPGGVRLRLTGHLGSWGLVPPELLSSARCIVLTSSGIVACRSPDGWHPWPGGRLQHGEDPRHAASREVFEETGHEVEPSDLRPVGVLHYRHVAASFRQPAPYPDFLQVVYVGRSAWGPSPHALWRDTDDWELESRDVTWNDVGILGRNPVQAAFVRAARSRIAD